MTRPPLDDLELLPAPGGGWLCPCCHRAASVFFGLAPDRRCRLCFWAEQRPDVLAELELGSRAAAALRRRPLGGAVEGPTPLASTRPDAVPDGTPRGRRRKVAA